MDKRQWIETAKRVEDELKNPEIVCTVLKQIGIDQRESNRELKPTGEETATEKQLKYLDSLGVKYPEDITKSQASELIEENK